MHELLGTFINALLSARDDSVCGAKYGTRSADRVNSRTATAAPNVHLRSAGHERAG